MSIKFAVKGSRPFEVRVNISKKTKKVNFSTGFFNKYDLLNEKPEYLREGYDPDAKQIVFEFCDKDDNTNQLLKLGYSERGNSAYCSIAPLLHNFKLSIDEISGEYKAEAIDVKLTGKDNRRYFLLDIKRRIKND